jgi:hypothetical protein
MISPQMQMKCQLLMIFWALPMTSDVVVVVAVAAVVKASSLSSGVVAVVGCRRSRR